MYLFTEPVDEYDVDYFEVDIDSTVIQIQPETANGMARLYYLLPEDLPNGAHTVIITAVNGWGSTPSDPFVFTKALPSKPSGIGLEQGA